MLITAIPAFIQTRSELTEKGTPGIGRYAWTRLRLEQPTAAHRVIPLRSRRISGSESTGDSGTARGAVNRLRITAYRSYWMLVGRFLENRRVTDIVQAVPASQCLTACQEMQGISGLYCRFGQWHRGTKTPVQKTLFDRLWACVTSSSVAGLNNLKEPCSITGHSALQSAVRGRVQKIQRRAGCIFIEVSRRKEAGISTVASNLTDRARLSRSESTIHPVSRVGNLRTNTMTGNLLSCSDKYKLHPEELMCCTRDLSGIAAWWQYGAVMVM